MSNYTNYLNILILSEFVFFFSISWMKIKVKQLKNKTSNWLRYRNKYTIDIVDEETIFKIMKFQSKPNKTTTSVSPALRVQF